MFPLCNSFAPTITRVAGYFKNATIEIRKQVSVSHFWMASLIILALILNVQLSTNTYIFLIY